MKNIIDKIIDRTCKEVVILYRLGTYLTADEVLNAILYELDKQHIDLPLTIWVFNKSMSIDDYIKQEVKSRLKFKLKVA